MATGKERWKKKLREGGGSVAFSPTGEFVAVIEADVRLYDAATGAEAFAFEGVEGHAIVALQFSPDGRTLAGITSALEDRTGGVVLWETATGRWRGTFTSPRGEVTTLAFSPDGRALATGAEDSTVLLWDLHGRLNPAVQKAPKLRPDDFDALWKELQDSNPEQAYRLIQRLARFPEEAAALVGARLPPAHAKKLDAAEINKLIADLDHAEFERREQASKALAEVGKAASAALTKALESRPSAEKKRRIEELLAAVKPSGPRPELVRPTRALELLERIATPEAKRVLEELAKGDPDAPLTRDAQATLKRLTAQGTGSGAPKD